MAKTENVSANFEVELYGNVRDITNDYTSYTRYEKILRSELKLVRFFWEQYFCLISQENLIQTESQH